MRNLVWLNLVGNEVSGEIPPEMVICEWGIFLLKNKLASQILVVKVKFEQFNISYTNLSNKIPRSLRSMPDSSA